MTDPASSPAVPRETNITVFVPGVLRPACGGAKELPLAAATVRQALERIEQQYPKLHQMICDETGKVRRHINIFVNSFNTRDGNGVDTPLAAGDIVTILTAVSGG